MAKRKALVIFVIMLFAFSLVAMGKTIQQAIRYNHKKHIDSGMACEDCHVNVSEGIRATIPALSLCMECHEEAVTESPEEEKVRTFSADGIEYPWIKVTTLRPDIYFSHRRHVAQGTVECQQCHGAMETLTQPPQKPVVKMTMKFCINCHREQNITEDCIACHR